MIEHIRGKRKNERVYPGISGRRPDKAKFRREEAIERQNAYDALSLQQKIDRLPPEPFCKKQRQRLSLLLEKQNKVIVPVESQAETTSVKKSKKK